MKRSISVCIIVITVLVFVGIFRGGSQKPPVNDNDSTDLNGKETEEFVEVNAGRVADAYLLREVDGMVVVFLPNDEIFMETGILAGSLPDELAEALKSGIGMKNEAELFDFLENYSS